MSTKSKGILRVGHEVFGPNHNHCPSCNSTDICALLDDPSKKGNVHLTIPHYCGNCEATFEFNYEFQPPEKLTFKELTDRQNARRAPVYTPDLNRVQLSGIARTIRNVIHDDHHCGGKRPILRDIFDEAVTHFDLTCGWEHQNGIVTTLINLLHRYARDLDGDSYHYLTIHDAIEHRARLLEATGP